MGEVRRFSLRQRWGHAIVLGSVAAGVVFLMPTPARTTASASSLPHIMVIMDENKAYSAAQASPYIIGNPDAPYVNSLADKYTSATQWFANQHNSPTDYLDLISGSNQGLGAGTSPPYSATTLVDELNTNGISWKAYMESMPSDCDTGGTTGLYEADHNPFVYFSDYRSLCSGGNGVVPYTLSQMSTDLNSSAPPDFVWITPNLCDDMHTNGGSCGTNGVADGDVWLSDNLPTVLSSSWYADNGIIIITWDESDGSDTSGGTFGDGGQIPTIVISDNSHGPFDSPGDHYATLRGIEEAYGVPLLENSADPSFGDITPAFGTQSQPPAAPTVTSVSPGLGAAGGGNFVTISGSHFRGTGFAATDVFFGDTDIPAGNAYPCPESTAGCFAVDSPTQITAYTPSGHAGSTVHVTVENAGGTSPTSSADTYGYVAAGAYTAMTPFRVCNTQPTVRPVNQCTGETLKARSTLTLQVLGEHNSSGQSVPFDASAVAVNLTGINDTSGITYLAAFPTGDPMPTTSNINLTSSSVQANLAIVRVGTSGEISVFNAAGSADVIVDVEGYFAPPSAPPVPGELHIMPPLRICDTRANTNTECAGATANPVPAGTWRRVVLSGLPPGATGGPSIPADGTAAAAVFNLTGTQGTKGTYLGVQPPNSSDACPTGAPATSNINLAAGVALPNRVISSLGPHQDVCIYNALGSIDLLIDVDGWFGNGNESAAGALFYSISPTRICDTRTGSGTPCAGEPLTKNNTELIAVAGVDGLPNIDGSTPPVAIVANLTGVSGSAPTYLTIYPSDVTSRPLASDLNPGPGVAIANLAIVGLAATGSSTGDVDLYNAVGTINAILDVAGWFQ